MEKLSLKKITMQKNANIVICGHLFVPESFKMTPLPLAIKGLLVGFSYKNTVRQKTVRKSRIDNDRVVRSGRANHMRTHTSLLLKKNAHHRGPV